MDMFDVVVEATGSPSGLGLAVQITRPMGVIVLKTTCAAANLLTLEEGQKYGMSPGFLIQRYIHIAITRKNRYVSYL